MAINITFLGTSAMVPTKERNHSAIFLSFKNHGLLLDCGEGTQRQFKIAEIKLTKITKILISHWHGDHVLGLPGLIQTTSALQHDEEIEIYGPKGIKKYMKKMFEAFIFDNKIKLKIIELKEGVFFENNEFILEAHELDHKIHTLGFKFIEKDRRRIKVKKTQELGIKEGPLMGKLQRGENIKVQGKIINVKDVTYVVKGKTIGYISDTVFCNGCIDIAKNCDLLITEGTYVETEQEKAEKYKHMTAKQAAMIAHKAEVGKLILTHVSQRYKDSSIIEKEAKDIFPDTRLAYDFMKVKL